MTVLSMSLLASSSLLFVAGDPPQDAAPQLRRAREAVGLERIRATKGRVILAGTADFYGVPSTFRIESALDGRYLFRVDGPLPRTMGFDGSAGWLVDATGMPLALPAVDVDETLLPLWFVTSAWLAEGAPLEITRDGDTRLVVQRRGGSRSATISLDGGTGRPAELTIATWRGVETWTLADWRDAGGLLAPHTITTATNGLVNAYRVASVSTTTEASSFAMPLEEPQDTVFDAKAPARLEVERAPTGHLLVHPRVNGKDVGWFILDTGAAVTVIAPAAADAAELPSFGKTPLPGAGANVQLCPFRGAKTFELGPVHISAPIPMVQMDHSTIDRMLGRTIAGVVGYDLFRRAVVAIDMSKSRVEIHDRASFARDGLAWTALVLKGRHPHVRARFEGDHEGLFRIDTGAGGAGVIFHAPTVDRLRLLEGRETSDAGFAGAGGLAKAKLGSIAWLELAGERVENPLTLFTRPGGGAFDDPASDGTIGGAIVGRFTMWLDYGRNRIAFERKRAAR